MKSSEVLAKAKGYIITCGWGQGDNEVIFPDDDNRKCCVATALGRAADVLTPDYTKNVSTYTNARDWFICANGDLDGYGTIVKWNDALERTEEEVLTAFDKAIALAQRKEAENATD